MSTTSTSTAVTAVEPVFIEPEPLALAVRLFAVGRGVDELLVHELVDAQRPQFPADARALRPAEGQFRAAALGLVDPDHPDIQPVRHVQGQRLVAGEHRAA